MTRSTFIWSVGNIIYNFQEYIFGFAFWFKKGTPVILSYFEIKSNFRLAHSYTCKKVSILREVNIVAINLYLYLFRKTFLSEQLCTWKSNDRNVEILENNSLYFKNCQLFFILIFHSLTQRIPWNENCYNILTELTLSTDYAKNSNILPVILNRWGTKEKYFFLFTPSTICLRFYSRYTPARRRV